MRVLRTAVIGAGRIGWAFHIPHVFQHDGFDLVAVVDPLQERLNEVKARFGVTGYLDCDELLNSEELDLVVIASPTRFHADQAILAFQHGCNVFCDKPIAPSLARADQMIAAMEANDRKLMVYQPHRGRADMVALQEILRGDLIGPVYMIKCALTSYARRNDWQALQKHGGGMLYNYGAHQIDKLLYLAGSRARRISCTLRVIASLGDADDVVKAVIETENGTILDLDINMASAHSMPPWHILGKQGSILFDTEQQAWQVRYFRPEELADIALHQELAAPERRYGSGETIPWRKKTFPLADFQPIDYYQECYSYFALDGKPFVPIAETRELTRVLEACRQSASE